MLHLRHIRLVSAALVLVASACCPGCGGGTPGVKPVVDRAGTLGTWIEKRGETSNARFVAQPQRTDKLRQITINDDGTFVLELVDEDGKPAGDGKVEGTWAIEKGTVKFAVSKNGLEKDLQSLAPARTRGREDGYGDDGKTFDMLRIMDLEGMPGEFVRKP